MPPSLMAQASIDDYHAALAPADRAICDALRTAIASALPDAEAKVWHAHPVWFLNGNPITGYSKLKSCIRLLFWSGQSFAAPGLPRVRPGPRRAGWLDIALRRACV